MQLVPSHGWFTGLRRFLKNRFTITLLAMLLAAICGVFMHDQVRQHEVARTIRDLRSLRPGATPASEVMALCRRDGLVPFGVSGRRYVEGSCDGTDCYFQRIIESDPVITWVAEHGTKFTGIKAAWFETLRLRPWAVRFTVNLKKSELRAYSIDFGIARPIPLHPYQGWWWSNVSVVNTTDLQSVIDPFHVRTEGPSPSNKNYAVLTRKNFFVVGITPGANEQEINTAFDIDLGCLSRHPCHAWGEVVPKAWSRYCQEELRGEMNPYDECLAQNQ